jgi:hypothetical protein
MALDVSDGEAWRCGRKDRGDRLEWHEFEILLLERGGAGEDSGSVMRVMLVRFSWL